MIICDRNGCDNRATYILNIDYLGQENFDRIDLCEKCFVDVQSLVRNPQIEKKPEENFYKEYEIKKFPDENVEPLSRVIFKPESELKTAQQPIKKPRGRPKKKKE